MDQKVKEMAVEVPHVPIRWSRVASKARRRRFVALLALLLAGFALTVAIAAGVLAGKTAIDPSFSPPLLGKAAASVEVSDPRLGLALIRSDGRPGYVLKAALEAEGLDGQTVVERWRLRPVAEDEKAGNRAATGRDLGRIVRVSGGADPVALRGWLPRPDHTGGYVPEVKLESLGGAELASAHGSMFFVVGRDCCRRYATPAYTAVLPRGWYLEEDFAPNPGDRHVTVARGPYDDDVVIDTSTLDSADGKSTVLAHASELEDLLSESSEGYRRLDWKVRHAGSRLVVEWSYEVEGDAFTDILFRRGDVNFAVLGRSTQSHFRETTDLARLIARSADPKSSSQ